MNVLIATDFTLKICNGKYYLEEAMSTILRRYHNSFGNITYCSRIKLVDEVIDLIDVTDMIDNIVEVKSLYHIMIGISSANIIKQVKNSDLVICRCGSAIAFCVSDYARKYKVPYLAEVMSCAWDAYFNHSLLGKLIAPYMYWKMKCVLKNATYSVYVTKYFLQKRYPSVCPSIAASNVEINDIDECVFENRIRKIDNMSESYLTIMTAAAVDVKYKGQEYVIKAIPKLNLFGIKVKYLLVGQGNQNYLKSIAKACNVLDQVVFIGKVSRSKVMELIDESDIYIQPSLQEGLPRSVIEAMSRGCVCLGANTAGIPELLPQECIFERKSVIGIVKAICNILKEDMRKYSVLNFNKSKEFSSIVLDSKRDNFFEIIKKDLNIL